jgi:6-phosphogluconolactonase
MAVCRSPALVVFVIALMLAAWPALPAAEPSKEPKPDKLWVFIGTYTGGAAKSKGIYRLELDLASGKLSPPEVAAESESPAFLAIHPSHCFLYSVNEVGDAGDKTGAVSAFALDQKTGTLKALNTEPSGGAGPCHLVVDRMGKHVLVANYGSGSSAVLPIGPDGRLGKLNCLEKHKGSGPNAKRQEAPHAHCATFSPDGRFAFVCDLGTDKVVIYRYNPDGMLTPNDPPAGTVAPGAGPRHFTFHPDGKHAYVINELGSSLTAFDYDPEHGALKEVQTLPTLPADFKGENTCAEVAVHPSGKFLYGSNRGQNSIAIFSIDPKTGQLTAAGHQGHDVKIPRSFGIDPTGEYLLVANQDSNNVEVFRIDGATGALTPVGDPVEVPAPVCVEMIVPGR